MADTPPQSTEQSPQPARSQPATDAGAEQEQPAGDKLQPGRGSRRARFVDSQSPSPASSPSRRRDQGGGKQEEFVNALINGDLTKFKELIQDARVDKNYRYGPDHHGTILEIACRNPDRGVFVKLLLHYVKPNINRVIPEPIHYAAQKGHDDSLRVLLSDKRTKVYALTSKGQTALHLACANVTADRAKEYARCIELLVPKMSIADINKPDCNGFTPFHTLVRSRGKKTSKSRSQSTKSRTLENESSEAGEEKKPLADARIEDDKFREQLARLMLKLTQGTLDVDSVRTKGRTAREDVELRFPQLRSLLPARRAASRADPHEALVGALHDGRIEHFRALLQQTNADGNPALDPNHSFGYPLHTTSLQLACDHADGEEFVKALLEAGADPNIPNMLNGKYPIHVVCEKGHDKELEALFEYSKVNVDYNCEDKFGNTPLHCTVDRISDDRLRETGRRKCLEILLRDKNLDVTRTNNEGYTALLLAVEDGNRATIKTFLGYHGFVNVNPKNLRFDQDGRPLRDVIAAQFPELRQLLLWPGTMHTRMIRQERRIQLFELLNTIRENEFVQQLQHARPPELSTINDNKYTLLQRAARYGMAAAARALLEAGVDPNNTFSGNPSPPGVIASYNCHNGVLEVLLDHPKFNVNATDAKGNTALHYAAKAKDNLETVILLLRHGADMTIPNKLGRSPFGKEQVELLLDQCVKTNGKNALEEDYEVILDYRLLAPRRHTEGDLRNHYVQVAQNNRNENGVVIVQPGINQVECRKLESEMNFLNMMSKNGGLSMLLEHPVAFSFLQLKWNRLRYLSYFNLGVYMLFMIFLNIYIITVTTAMSSRNITLLTKNSSHDVNNSTRSTDNVNYMMPFGIFAFIFWLLLAIREIIQCLLGAAKYVKSLENYLDLSVLIFSLASLILPLYGVTMEVVRSFNVFTIMFTCVELFLLLGRVSRFAKYIEMLKVVIKNYLFPLVSYSIILVAFGLSFHTLCFEESMAEKAMMDKCKNNTNGTNCNNEEPADFRSWYMSMVMVIVMMIGELEFKSLPDRSPLSIILFVFFVLLVTVVLLNLLTGIAVSDTAKIENAAQQLRLQSRVGVVLRSERILVNLHNSDCAALRFCSVPSWLRRRLRRALLFPGTELEGREGRVKPNQTGEVELGAGADVEARGERKLVDGLILDRATLIISRRGEGGRLTLDDVDRHVQEVLKTLKEIEVRCGPFARGEVLLSARSLLSESGLDDQEPETPSAVFLEKNP